jgi:hypothetical protein
VAFRDGFQEEDNVLAGDVTNNLNAMIGQGSEKASISCDLSEFFLFNVRKGPFFISSDEEPRYDESRLR